MNDNKRDRIDVWLPIVGTVVLFRVLLFFIEPVTSLLPLLCSGIPFMVARDISKWLVTTCPILTPIIAVALAVLIARAIENRVIRTDRKAKGLLLVVCTVLALLPWKFQICVTQSAPQRSAMSNEVP